MASTQRPPGRNPLPYPLTYPLPSPLPYLLLLLGLVVSLTWADVAPSLLEEPQSALLSGQHQVALQCRVAPPGAAVRWFYQGRPLDPAEHEGLVVEANRLVFDPPAHIPANAGSYRCLATSGLGSILSRAAVLSLPVLEKFAPGEDLYLNGTEGGFAVLPCLLPRSLPPATALFLTSDGRTLNTSRDGVYQLPSGSVVIRNLRRSDAGRFRCVAVNPSTQENVTSAYSIQLDVTPPPPGGNGTAYTVLVGADSREVGVQVGQEAVLECPSLAFPRPTITWSKYPGTLPQQRASVSDGNLHLKNVGLGDGGTYLCEVGLNTKRVVQLNVQELPTVQVNHTQMQVSVGQRVDLHCKVRGYPEVKVSWFHNAQEKQRPQPVSPEGSTWTIARVGLADAGVYQCVAANNASSAYATIILQVSQPSRVSGSRTGLSTSDTSGDGISDDEDIASPSSRKKDRRRKKKKKGRRKNLNGRTKPRKNRKNDGKAKLVPPSRPEVTLLSETSVMLNWTVPENDGLNVVFFRVQYKEVSPGKGQWRTDETDIDPNKRRWEVNKLKSGGTYKFRIAAVYSNNDNKHSPNSKRFTLSVASRKEPRPPEFSPKIVEVKPIVHENVYALHVKWQYHPVDKTPVAGFMIKYREWGQGEEGWKEVPLVGSGIRTHLLTHLKPDTDYEIKMQCFNSAGSSKDSNKVAYRTSSSDNNKSPPFPFPTHSSNNPPPFPSDSSGEGGGRGKGGREGEEEGSGPPPSNTQSNSEMLYMILGIVLGAMLLLLVIFMAMCWWRQRQQRRADARDGDAIHPNKFHDQAYRIHHDSMRKKTMNGYPLNGLNGLVANGHGPNHNHKVNISVNPLSEVEGGQTYTGHSLPNGHGPLMYGNHGGNSDNNFNSIRQGKPAHSVTTGSGEPSLHGHQADMDSDQEEDFEDEDSAMLPDSTPSPAPLHYPSPHPHPLSRPPYSSNPELAPRVSPRPRLPVSFEHLHTADGGLEGGERYPLGVYQGRERGYAPCPQHSSSSQGRSRKRRKRPHSREHSTKDQATNTDLSSNEGTIEFTTFNRSPTGSDHSRTFTNNSTQCSDVIRTSEAL